MDVYLPSLLCIECSRLPVGTHDAKAVYFEDKLYVGGGTVTTTVSLRDEASLYIYTPTTDLWEAVSTPVSLFAPITYHSQLILVGGVEYVGESQPGPLTNKLWTLSAQDQWQETLPPMKTKRYGASAVSYGDHLLVAGGGSEIEIYNSRYWVETKYPLSRECWDMKSTVLDGHWYLMGGYEQEEEVYYASLDSLVQASEALQPLPIWKRLPNVPCELCSCAVLDDKLIAVGGLPLTSKIHIYSLHTKSWMYVGDIPVTLCNTCTIQLPTGELMIIGGLPEMNMSKVYKFILKDLDIQLQVNETVSDLRRGISLLKTDYKSVTESLREENERLTFENRKLQSQLSQALTTGEMQYMSSTTWNLRGIEICGERNVVVYSSRTQQITWEGYGLRLHIHEGSLPAGVEQCILDIKASIAGQYEFPESSFLVSAIFWLRCETVHKFVKPITVEIQHCARSENVKLNFVKAFCSQKQLPYTFKQLRGNFTSYSSFGVIELNSFSGIGVVQEGSKERNYLANLLYKEVKIDRTRCIIEIYFVVIWNVDAHHTVMINRFKDAQMVTNQPLAFDTNQVEFMISNCSANSWKITVLNSPVINKRDVDQFVPGITSWIPYSHFKAKFLGDITPIPDLECVVNVVGAREPHNKFTVDIIPRGLASSSTQQIQSSGVLVSSKSAKPKLKDLQRELYSKLAHEWEDIGIQIDIEEGQLKQIKADNTGDCKQCLREMLRVWLDRVDPPPSWSDMAEAIEFLGHEDIAKHIRSKYCIEQTNDFEKC